MKHELRTTIQTSKCGRFCLQRCSHMRSDNRFCKLFDKYLRQSCDGRLLREPPCYVVTKRAKDKSFCRVTKSDCEVDGEPMYLVIPYGLGDECYIDEPFGFRSDATLRRDEINAAARRWYRAR